MKILVIGGFNEEQPDLKKETEDFTRALGHELVCQGHTLINACMTEFDEVITNSASATLEKGGKNPQDHILGYVIDGITPSHKNGKIRTSELKDWELGGSKLRIPEPIDVADVVITVSGFDGVQRAANWARIAKKPILPIPKFKGASKAIYREERENFEANLGGKISIDEFEDLSETTLPNDELARKVLNLAEHIMASGDVFVIMSFSEDPGLEDAYNSYKEVCEKFSPKYRCLRMDEITDVKRITPGMFDAIKSSAFVIADLSFERPNVYYELGYADALDKPIITTAKAGTKVHFDAKDLPIIFWESQTGLKKELTQRIEQIAQLQGRVLKQP